MPTSFNIEKFFIFLVKYKKYIAVVFALQFIIFIGVISFNYFKEKKHALVSANLAIAIANLSSEKPDEAMYFFEQAFNASSGIYRVISASGIVEILQKSQNLQNEEKVINILKILQSAKKDNFFSLVLDTVYFSQLVNMGEDIAKNPNFINFQNKILASKNDILKEQLSIIFLNSKDVNNFRGTISKISGEAIQGTSETNSIKERFVLLKEI